MKIKGKDFEIEFCDNQYELTVFSKKTPTKHYFYSFKSLLKYINKNFKINQLSEYEKLLNLSQKNQKTIDSFTTKLINEYLEISG